MKKIPIKTNKEIEIMREGCRKLAEVMLELEASLKIGISTLKVDTLAEKLILGKGGVPSFKGYGDRGNEFPATICASLNEEVVHGIPNEKTILQEGDIFKVDIGMKYNGMHSDMARTFAIGKISDEKKKIIGAVKESFYSGIKAIRPYKKIGRYAKAIEKSAKKNGFSVIRDLVSHGIGKELHEEPQIPNYFERSTWNFKVVPGMTFALEPMINEGTEKVFLDSDGWTFKTLDGKISAHWENTVLITRKGVEILTKV